MLMVVLIIIARNLGCGQMGSALKGNCTENALTDDSIVVMQKERVIIHSNKPWLRANGVSTNGAAAKVLNFDSVEKGAQNRQTLTDFNRSVPQKSLRREA